MKHERILAALQAAEATVSEDIAMLRDSSRDGTGHIGALARAQLMHLERVQRLIASGIEDAKELEHVAAGVSS